MAVINELSPSVRAIAKVTLFTLFKQSCDISTHFLIVLCVLDQQNIAVCILGGWKCIHSTSKYCTKYDITDVILC